MSEESKNIYRNLAIIVGVIILLFAMHYAIKYEYVSDGVMVITMFGILATVIVLGNFSQVTQIKNETMSEITNIKTNLTTEITDIKTETRDKISKIENNVDKYSEKVEGIKDRMDKVRNDMYDVNENPIFQEKTDIDKKVREVAVNYWREQEYRYDTLVNELFKRLTAPNYTELIEAIVQPNGFYECMVMKKGGKRSLKASVRLEGENVVFRNTSGKIITDVVKIDDKECHESELAELVHFWVKIRQTSSESAVVGKIYKQ